jgi:hypothetical protein
VTFAEQQIEMLEATGLWPLYPILPIKQYDDAKSKYTLGVLKDVGADEFLWWPGESLFTFQNVKPMAVNRRFVENLFLEQGWMVD